MFARHRTDGPDTICRARPLRTHRYPLLDAVSSRRRRHSLLTSSKGRNPLTLTELADLMDVPTRDLLETLVKTARTQEGFEVSEEPPDEVLEKVNVFLEDPMDPVKSN